MDVDIDSMLDVLLEDSRTIEKSSILISLEKIEQGLLLGLIKCLENFWVSIIKKTFTTT